MTRAIRAHLRDFLAILFMSVAATGVAAVILSEQRFYLPAWVPLVGTDFYEIEAELSTAQAVVPGQGQTVNIAGVKVGDIGGVELDDGVAVVQLKIQRRYAPVFRDASLLLRPRTGLKDMYLSLDPGTEGAGAIPEGGRIPVSNTVPDVNPDEIWSVLDSDTRGYLQILLNAGGEALGDGQTSRTPTSERAGRGAATGLAPIGPTAAGSFGTTGGVGTPSADLRETFKRFEPTNRDVAAFTTAVATRRRNLKRLVHNFQLLVTELGTRDRQLSRLVNSANANFRALGEQDVNLRAALRLLPGTLEQTEATLRSAESFAAELGPTLEGLRPAARALGPALRETRPFLRITTPIVRDQLRPFARDTRPAVRDLRATATGLSPVIPRLTRTTGVLNSLLNTLAYNPPGSEEGYLFWASWLNHVGASIFSTQDAHGTIRRGLFLATCSSLGVLDQIGARNPNLQVLIDLLDAPRQSEVCPTPKSGASPRKDGLLDRLAPDRPAPHTAGRDPGPRSRPGPPGTAPAPGKSPEATASEPKPPGGRR